MRPAAFHSTTNDIPWLAKAGALPPLCGATLALATALATAFATAFASFFHPCPCRQGLAGLCPRQGRGMPPARKARIQPLGAQHLRGCPGMAIVPVQDGRLVMVEGFAGSRSSPPGAPTSADTVFQTGQRVKTFTPPPRWRLWWIRKQLAWEAADGILLPKRRLQDAYAGQWVNFATCLEPPRRAFRPSSANTLRPSRYESPRCCLRPHPLREASHQLPRPSCLSNIGFFPCRRTGGQRPRPALHRSPAATDLPARHDPATASPRA